MASFEKAVEQKNKHSEVRKTENAENRNKTLHWGTKTNYRKWSENMESIMSEMYDINADFITTGKMIEYHEPEPVYEEFRKEVDPLGIKKAIYKEECIEAYKNRAKLAKVKIAMWATIWMTLSEMSKEKVKERKEYEEALADNKNVSTLWKLISLVHSTAGTGNEINDRLNAKEVIEKMEQGQKESILSFKNRLMDAFKTSVELGANEESVEVQIQDFLRKLDKKRFGNFYLKLKESVTMKYGQYPKSVNEAVELATNYSNSMNYDLLLSNQNNIKSNVETVFFTTKNDENKKKKKKLRKDYNDKIVPKEDIVNDNVSYYPNVQCHKCLQFGHYKSNCPTWKPEERKLIKQKQSKRKNEIENEMINIISINDDDRVLFFKDIQGKHMINNDYVFMDSCASVSLFNNKNLLTNIRPCKKNYNIFGINAEALIVSLEGDLLHFGTVLYSEKAIANILSLSKVENMLNVDYEQGFGFSVYTKNNDQVYHFQRIGDGIYAAKFNDIARILMSTVLENEKLYSKREVEAAKKARTFQKRLGYAPSNGIIDLISAGGIKNAPVTEHDMRRADSIYGKDASILKGRTTRSKTDGITFEHVPIPLIINQVLHADIMFVEGKPFLITVSEPLCLTMVSELINGRKYDAIQLVLENQINKYTSKGFKIGTICSDGEGAIAKLERESGLTDKSITINISGPGQHVPTIERKIRQVKERVRIILHSLPYTLAGFLLVYLVYYAVSRINMFKTTVKMDKTSPAETFTGRKIDFIKDLRFEFGEYVQMFNPNIVARNSMESRTDGGIALLQAGNLQGSVKFFSLNSKRIVTRDKWTSLPIPENVINYMNKLATQCSFKISKEPRFEVGSYSEDSAMLDDATHSTEPMRLIIDPIAEASRSISESKINESDVLEEATVADGLSKNLKEDEIDILMSDVIVEPDHQHYTRSNKGNDQSKIFEHGLHISHKKAAQLFGEEAANASLLKEAKQMIDKQVWKPQVWNELSNEQKRFKTLKVFSFFKDKWFPDGKFEKLKARSAVDGSKQNKNEYDDLFSPTVATTSIFFIATVAAIERRHVLKFDVPGAYLNTDIEKELYLIIDPTMAKIIIQLDKTFEIGLRKDNSIVVQLMKGQYGCVESAKLWYNHIKQTLEDCGFIINPIDGSVFNCTRLNCQITVAIHVDDGIITSTSHDNIQWVKDKLSAKYGNLSIHEGRVIPYTGMTFDFTEEGYVKVSMEKYIEDIRKDYAVLGTAKTPANTNLFNVDNNSKILNDVKLKEFHSTVMKLMWLAKRCAPEILVSIAYLSTRIQCANENDLEKLNRVIKYLNNKDIKFEIRFGNNKSNHIQIDSFIDVSYAVHADMKSHTGEVMRINNGPGHVSSNKQNINTKSTTEAELVGLSDKSGTSLMYKQFAKHQGYNLDAIVIYQDNKSTINLVKKGHSTSQRTRHINIRYFYLKDRIESEDIRIEYIESENMLADILTKPLQGKLFYKLRKILCNEL